MKELLHIYAADSFTKLPFQLNGGIIFDRFRIMDFLPKIKDDVLIKIKAWDEGVMDSSKIMN